MSQRLSALLVTLSDLVQSGSTFGGSKAIALDIQKVIRYEMTDTGC